MGSACLFGGQPVHAPLSSCFTQDCSGRRRTRLDSSAPVDSTQASSAPSSRHSTARCPCSCTKSQDAGSGKKTIQPAIKPACHLTLATTCFLFRLSSTLFLSVQHAAVQPANAVALPPLSLGALRVLQLYDCSLPESLGICLSPTLQEVWSSGLVVSHAGRHLCLLVSHQLLRFPFSLCSSIRLQKPKAAACWPTWA